MTAALRHRGPDGVGCHVDPRLRVGLGHARLTVIDPAGGHQPMWNEDHTVAVIFNGEIYNAPELRARLVARGHSFSSDHSDTEVLVHGYEEWGRELPGYLNGMFAFAILDARRARLFLARDRFGEKPLYYAARPDLFVFGSELSALRQHPSLDVSPDPRGIQKLFAYGYIPAPTTAFRNIQKLQAGWTLEYEVLERRLRSAPYWRFRLQPDESLADADEPRLVDELRDRLSAAVQRRLVSDVPLGLFLSGGVDSATVLAFACRHLPASSVSTFTVGFSESSYDESDAALQVAQAFGTQHHATRLDLERAYELIPDVLRRLDEPLGDPSLLPTYLLCRFARESVTVALSGDGGDELFAGYDPFAALAPARAYSRTVPPPVHALLRRLAARLPQGSGYMSWDFRIRRALTGLSYPESLWNPVWMAPIEPAAMRDYFEAPLPVEELYEEAIAVWQASDQRDLVSRTLEFFTVLYLQNDILTKVDRAAMMVSLETRAVFLDNDLVDFVCRLPNRFKFRKGTRKYLLRRALEGLVGPDVLTRRKRGFGIPLASWLRKLAPPKGSGLPNLKAEALREAWRLHCTGARDERMLLWTWLSADAWHTTLRRDEVAVH
jgi:asparagine synthase (glutamine-hydrolysing)